MTLPQPLHVATREGDPVLAEVKPQRFIEHIVDFYERAAPSYDEWAGGVNARAARHLAGLVSVQPGESALDIGCGTGLVTRHLSDATGDGGFTFGVDISSHMLAVAHRSREPYSNTVFATMPAERIVVRSESFDVVTVGQTLPYLVDPLEALGEAHRVLRQGGRLGISCQCRMLCTAAENVFYTQLAHYSARYPLEVPRLPADRAWFGEPNRLRQLLAAAGFDDIRITQSVTGNHTADAHGWTELMMFAGPYPHAMISHLGPKLRTAFERRVEHAMGQLSTDEAFRYHRAFTFAVATRS